MLGAAMAVMLAGLALGDFAHSPDATLRLLASLPIDVRAHIDRAIQCNHWAGEEGYDAARRREIAAAVRGLRCDRLDREAAGLKRRYAGSPRVLAAIGKYADGID